MESFFPIDVTFQGTTDSDSEYFDFAIDTVKTAFRQEFINRVILSDLSYVRGIYTATGFDITLRGSFFSGKRMATGSVLISIYGDKNLSKFDIKFMDDKGRKFPFDEDALLLVTGKTSFYLEKRVTPTSCGIAYTEVPNYF